MARQNNNRWLYPISVTVDLCKAGPENGRAFLADLNDALTKCGVGGRLVVRVPLLRLDATTSRILSRKEREEMKSMILLEFQKLWPDWDVEITMRRRKSRQSCSQPKSR